MATTTQTLQITQNPLQTLVVETEGKKKK